MNKYLLTFNEKRGFASFEFDEEGYLIDFSIKAELTKDQHYWLLIKMPIKEDEIQGKLGSVKNTRLELIPPDLSFEAFWQEYNYKTGNKSRSEKLWNELSDDDKIKVFNHMPRYRYHMKTTGIQQAYPETFLSQRRFENIYATH